MSNTPSRPGGLLYCGVSPVGNTTLTNLYQKPGVGWVADRFAAASTPYRQWCRDAIAAGATPLWYVNIVDLCTFGFDAEGQRLYGGTSQANVESAHPDYMWSFGTGNSPSTYSEFTGCHMLNTRPGSPWILHVVNWAVDFWTNRSYDLVSGVKRQWLHGFFLDVIGNEIGGSTPGAFTLTDKNRWTEGNHDLIRRLRAALGPDVVLIGNGQWNRIRGTDSVDIATITPVDSANATSMSKGGHPGLNGSMFESANPGGNAPSISRANNTINGGTESVSPNGWTWATQAGNRKRFIFLSHDAANGNNNLTQYRNIVDATWLILNRTTTAGDYCGTDIPYVSGTTATALNDYLGSTWLWSPPGGTPPPGTPLPPNAGGVTASVAGSNVTVAVNEPADTGVRTHVDVYYRTSVQGAWTGAMVPANGTLFVSATDSGAAGTVTLPATSIANGSYYFGVFNRNNAGPTYSSPIITTPGGGLTTVGSAPATIDITPKTVTLSVNQQLDFQATTSDASAVTWATTAGSIDSNGLLTAPATVPGGGTLTVTATSSTAGSATAIVTITAAVTRSDNAGVFAAVYRKDDATTAQEAYWDDLAMTDIDVAVDGTWNTPAFTPNTITLNWNLSTDPACREHRIYMKQDPTLNATTSDTLVVGTGNGINTGITSGGRIGAAWYGGQITSHTISGLQPSTRYSFLMVTMNWDGTTSLGVLRTVTTASATTPTTVTEGYILLARKTPMDFSSINQRAQNTIFSRSGGARAAFFYCADGGLTTNPETSSQNWIKFESTPTAWNITRMVNGVITTMLNQTSGLPLDGAKQNVWVLISPSNIRVLRDNTQILATTTHGLNFASAGYFYFLGGNSTPNNVGKARLYSSLRLMRQVPPLPSSPTATLVPGTPPYTNVRYNANPAPAEAQARFEFYLSGLGLQARSSTIGEIPLLGPVPPPASYVGSAILTNDAPQ